MAIGVTYKATRLMVSLVLEEVILKSWRGINFEKTAREYKRWSEISPEQLWLGIRDGFGSDDLLIFYDVGIVIVIRWWEEKEKEEEALERRRSFREKKKEREALERVKLWSDSLALGTDQANSLATAWL